MILKIEHIGIAVKDRRQAGKLFEMILGTASYKSEEVAREGVVTEFFHVGETKIELLEATQTDSPVARFITKRGEGIHHLAFEVDDIHSEMARLKAAGFELLSDAPKAGADNKLICFLHPKCTGGVLVELCQENKSS